MYCCSSILRILSDEDGVVLLLGFALLLACAIDYVAFPGFRQKCIAYDLAKKEHNVIKR